MSKIIKLIGLGLTGGFSKYPDLNARFTAWIVFTFISLGAFAFDAWISYSVFAEYLEYIGSTGNVAGLILSTSFALAATVSVSVIAYAFVSYRRSIGTGEKLSDSLRFAGYLASFLYLIFMSVSILANIQGATQAAERSAQAAAPLDDSRLTATTNEWTKEKQATAARYDTELRDLKSRIAAIENGTSKEQGRINGKRGNVTWKGNLTAYGRALLADIRAQITAKEAERAEQLQALDNTYQARLNTESASFDRIAGKHSERKERATTAIRLIVFLIYPIALLIAIFNAHFLLDASIVINTPVEAQSASTTGKKTTFSTATLATNTSPQIGFKLPYMDRKGPTQNDTFEGFDPAQFKADILHEIKDILSRQDAQPHPAKVRESLHTDSKVILHNATPYNLGKKYNLSAHQKKQLNKVNKAYTRLYKKEGKRPTYTAIADATGLDRRTVKKYVSLIETNNP